MMKKMYLCSECGQDIHGYKDQCPYCKTTDSLIAKEWGSTLEEYEDIEEYAEDTYCEE